MQNTNQRSSDRPRESTVADAVRAAATSRFERERATLDRMHDRVRAVVDAEIAAAGAEQSVVAQQAAQQLDALRSDHTARLRDNQKRERVVLDRRQNAAVSPENAVARAEDTMSELRDLEHRRNDLIAAMAIEAARLRDALAQDVQRTGRRIDQNAQSEPVAGPDVRVDGQDNAATGANRASEAPTRGAEPNSADRTSSRGTDRTAVINAALNRQESRGLEAAIHRTRTTDTARVANLNNRLDAAEAANRRQIAAVDSARQEADRLRSSAEPASRERAALDRRIAALDQQRDAYRARADALASAARLIEQGRTDVAERFLDAVRVADGGRRRAVSQDERQREQQRVDRLRQMEDSRQNIVGANQFAVLDRKFSELPPIKELWERAAARAKADAARLQGRELYERALETFKRLLTNEQDETARAARALFERDGLRFARDQQGALKATLPMLDDPYVHSQIDLSRHADMVRVSGQHLRKIEDNGDPVDPANLAFQIARDNMQMDARTGPLSKFVRRRVAERIRVGDQESNNPSFRRYVTGTER